MRKVVYDPENQDFPLMTLWQRFVRWFDRFRKPCEEARK